MCLIEKSIPLLLPDREEKGLSGCSVVIRNICISTKFPERFWVLVWFGSGLERAVVQTVLFGE